MVLDLCFCTEVPLLGKIDPFSSSSQKEEELDVDEEDDGTVIRSKDLLPNATLTEGIPKFL